MSSMKKSTDIRNLSALEQGRLIREKHITSPELTKLYLSYSKQDFCKNSDDDTKINAYISIDEEAAMQRATEVQADIEAGKYGSFESNPLAGVPVAVKDNICIDGGITTSASKMLENFRPPYNATVIDKMSDAGSVIIGKSNMDEFAMGGSTETSYFGITRNPWDLSRVPGGSSGGSAAAVAAGMAPISIGSDTGGSIRQPCSFTGLTGMKPTYGSVSRYGAMAFASSLDQIGPLCRNALDCAALLSILSGPDEKDNTCVAEKSFDASWALDFDASDTSYFKNKKIGIPVNYFTEGISTDVKDCVMKAVDTIRSFGAIVEETELPLATYGVPTYLIISFAEATSNLARYDGIKYGFRSDKAKEILETYYKSRSEGFGTEVKRRVLLGSFVLSSGYFDAYYKKALKVRHLIKKEFDEALGKFDFILAPTTPTVAYGLGGKISDPLAMYLGDIFTASANLAGIPSAALPCGFGEGGMPAGMQLIGKPHSDMELLKAAAAYQAGTDWHNENAWEK